MILWLIAGIFSLLLDWPCDTALDINFTERADISFYEMTWVVDLVIGLRRAQRERKRGRGICRIPIGSLIRNVSKVIIENRLSFSYGSLRVRKEKDDEVERMAGWVYNSEGKVEGK